MSTRNDGESAEQEKQVSEEEMLDIAEGLLRQLAEKLLQNEWSVRDVFDHPQLVHVIPEYDKDENVVAISAQNFLGRMYQIGFQEITQLQVACMMRVLGKFELENAILFADLVALLENYGVPDAKSQANANDALNESNPKSEVPQAMSSPARPGASAEQDS